MNTIICLTKEKERYEQALDEIEEYIKGTHWPLMNYIREDILGIINEAKREGNK